MSLAPCPHRPPCPGCPAYGAPLRGLDAHARLERLARDAGVALARIEGTQLAYRHRARLAVRGRASAPKVGIFQLGTHDVVDIPRCAVHHPLVNEVAAGVRRAIIAAGLPPYRERSHAGLVRYLQVMVDADGPRAQLVVVCNGAHPEPARPLLDRIVEQLPTQLHGLFWNGQPARGNAILGPHWAHLAGPEALPQRVGGVTAHFPPDAFSQNNFPTYRHIVDWVHARVPDDATVAELYAGVGAIGLGLLSRVRSVAFNEVGEGSLRGLRAGLSALPAAAASRAHVVPGDAGSSLGVLEGANVVIVDPPRKGLAPALRAALCDRPPGRLLYVSCGLSSFERDAEALREAGHTLRELAAVDLFPFTGHLETLAYFEGPARQPPRSAP